MLLLPIGSIHGDDPRSVADSVRGWTVLFRCPAAFRLPKLTTGVLLRVLLQRSAQSELVRRRQSVRQLVGNVDRQGTSACFRLCSLSLVHDAPCGLQSCKNRPAPFPGRMSYKATKPGLICLGCSLYLVNEPVFEPQSWRCPSKYCNHTATEVDQLAGLLRPSSTSASGMLPT